LNKPLAKLIICPTAAGSLIYTYGYKSRLHNLLLQVGFDTIDFGSFSQLKAIILQMSRDNAMP